MQIRSPYALAILLPLLVISLMAMRHSAIGLTRKRFWGALIARLALIVALGLILLDVRMVLPHNERSVVFVMDVSESMAPTARRHILSWTRRAWEEHQAGDRAGLVVFGSKARLEAPLAPSFAPGEPGEGLPRDSTRIHQALRLAAGLLRGESAERHVVLLSDGNGDETLATREAMALASAGIRITTVAIEMDPSPREVLIGKVVAPHVVNQDEPFLLKVEVVARSGGSAELHIVRDDQFLEPHKVELAPGVNRITIPQRLKRADAYIYEVSVQARGDGDGTNNIGGAIVRVRGRAKVLLVMGDEVSETGVVLHPAKEVAAPLAAALRKAGFDVTVRNTDALPLGLDELIGFNAFVFGNVSSERWTQAQMEAVRRYVFDQGGGLVALGGTRSFGMGGYYRTPIEQALPVNSDVRGKKVLPSLALVFCLDRSGSMDGQAGPTTKLALAREGAVRSLELLQPFDQVGVIAFDSRPNWVVDVTHVDKPRSIKTKIHGIGSGGGTMIAPALREALGRLGEIEAQIKHVVLLTDGRSGESDAEFGRIRSDFIDEKITLTTVGIGDGVDKNLLQSLASGTGGRYLWAPDATTVPRLLTKEAVTASRALLVERRVVPRHRGQLGKLGIDWATAPPLLGFVMTVPKPGAEVILDTGPEDTIQDGPILVRWRYGLGKTAAFTSDAAARWCARWVGWSGFPQLMGATVRWVAREPQAPGFETALQLEQGLGLLSVKVHAPDGSPVNGLSLGANVTGPTTVGPLPRLGLTQVGPGAYEAEFDVKRAGAYFATVDRTDADGARQPVANADAVLAYPREYRHLTHNAALLDRLAQITQGESLTLDDDPAKVYGGDRQGHVSYRPLAPYLFVAAAVLLVIEVVIRRLVLPEAITRVWDERRARRAAAAAAGASARSGSLLKRLRSHKQDRRQEAAERREQSRGASRRLDPAPTTPTQPEASPESPELAEVAEVAPEPKPKPKKPKKPKKKKPPRRPPPTDSSDSSSMSKLLEAKRKARGKRRGE